LRNLGLEKKKYPTLISNNGREKRQGMCCCVYVLQDPWVDDRADEIASKNQKNILSLEV